MLYLRLSDAKQRNKTTTKDGIMEQKILEIIQENYNEFTGTNEAEIASSREIAAHVFEFVEWIGFEAGPRLFFREITCTWLHTPLPLTVELKEYTTSELYQYWLTNVKE